MGTPGTSRTTTANCISPLNENPLEALNPADPKGRNRPHCGQWDVRPTSLLADTVWTAGN